MKTVYEILKLFLIAERQNEIHMNLFVRIKRMHQNRLVHRLRWNMVRELYKIKVGRRCAKVQGEH